MIRRVDRWLFAAGSARRLAVVRIGLFSTLAIRLSRPLYLELAGQPRALFRPLSFMRLVGGMPPPKVVLVLQVVGVLAALAGAAGAFTRFTAPTAWACALVLGGMHTSIGKVMHNDILLLLCIFPLLFASIADVLSVDSRLGRTQERGSIAYGWPIRTALVVVAGAYFFSGFSKLANSGIGWVTTENMRWVLYASSDAQSSPNFLALFLADRPPLAHLLAAGTLLYELAWPVVLLKPKFAWLLVPGAVFLHAGIFVTMKLDYSAQVATVVFVATDWDLVREAFNRSRRRIPVGIG